MRQAPSAIEFFSPRKNCHLLSELIPIYLEFTYITLCYLSLFTRNMDTLDCAKTYPRLGLSHSYLEIFNILLTIGLIYRISCRGLRQIMVSPDFPQVQEFYCIFLPGVSARSDLGLMFFHEDWSVRNIGR